MEKSKLTRFLEAFLALKPRLSASARLRTGSNAVADDLIQDTWMKLERGASENIANTAGFVSRVAHNATTDYLRKERRRLTLDGELADLLGEGIDDLSPERHLISRQNLRAVQAALDTLPEKTRRIFLMNRLEGISHRRLAERFGMSEEAVYYHIRRALEKLATVRDDLGI
ncbi:RNA polymerase sigma factor [Shinella sp. BYT-45]|uniref:RNA polymerase sigma factor n=1 Tax=Shinella sp. BYT-45 TaxID=3377377 RepID=UPI00397FC667